MNSSPANILYVTMVGAWLAVLQVVLFLSLEMLLSSAVMTFLVVVFAWLIGAALGVWIPAGRYTALLMGISTAAPYTVYWLLELRPFDTSLIWLHGILVGLTALLAGQFFQQERKSFRNIADLFFWENNGFTFGLLFGGLGMFQWGRAFLVWAPACGLALVLAAALLRKASQAAVTRQPSA